MYRGVEMDINLFSVKKSQLIFINVLFLFAFSIFSQVYAYELNLTTIDNGEADVGFYSAIGVDPVRHNVHTVYYDRTNHTLKHAELDHTGAWKILIIDDSNNFWTQGHIALHVDRYGTVHVAYVLARSRVMYAKKKRGGAWSKTEIDRFNLHTAAVSQVDIDVDNAGQPYIVYINGQREIKIAYEDREFLSTRWVFVSDPRFSTAWGGFDMDLIQTTFNAAPKVNLVYLLKTDNELKLKLLSYDTLTSTWSEQNVVDFGPITPGQPALNASPPFSMSYEHHGGTHHVSYNWQTLPASSCYACGYTRAYYVHSTATGWTTPELLSGFFADNIRYISRLRLTTNGEPVIVAENTDHNIYYARKSGGIWNVGSTQYQEPYEHTPTQPSFALDSCNNIHVGAYDYFLGSLFAPRSLVYILGVQSPGNNNCEPKAPSSSSSSGYSQAKRECREVFTSYTELPRLECDFMNVIAVKADLCPFNNKCSFEGIKFARKASSAKAKAYNNMATLMSKALSRSRKSPDKTFKKIHKSLDVLKPVNVDKATMKRAKSRLSKKASTNEVIYTIAKIIHKASFAEAVPKPVTTKVNKGKWVAVEMKNMAWLSMRDVTKAGDLKLEIIDEQEKIKPPKRGTLLWPAAIYKFSFTGKQDKAGYTEISINFAGLGYRNTEKVRIFEVGKGFVRDITTHVDTQRKVVTGKTGKLVSYVLIETL